MKNFVRQYTPPSDRFAEILCGLIMLLTFTLAGGIAKADASELIFGAVSCAVAWGIIDGTIFLLNSLFQRGWQMRMIAEIRAMSPNDARDRLRKEFDARYSETISPGTRELVYRDIIETVSTRPIQRPSLTKQDLMGGLGLVVIEAICSLPAIIPLIIYGDGWYALRISNIALLTVLGIVGYQWSGWAGWKGAGRLLITAAICGVGILMVVVAIVMGG